MKYVYASRTGNTEKLVQALGVVAEKIHSGEDVVNEDFTLFTYTDGNGEVPKIVDKYLQTNGKYLKEVIVAGNKERHPNTFAKAADVIEKTYGVACLYRMDGAPDENDIKAVKEALSIK